MVGDELSHLHFIGTLIPMYERIKLVLWKNSGQL